jgi:hypothetical protein
MSFGFGLGFPRSVSSAGGPTLNFQFAGSTTLDPQITFTRASTATYFNSAGVLTSAAINAPRFDYNPSTLAAQGLLIEESRANLFLQSADFTTTWGQTNVTITANTTASPDGGTNGDTLLINSAGAATNQTSQTFTAGSTITISVFAKKNASNFLRIEAGNLVNCWFNLNTGVTGTNSAGSGNVLFSAKSIQAISGGWYRCVLTVTTSTITTIGVLLFATNTDGTTSSVSSSIFLWGAQLEAGAFPTSYIPTTTTALTRAADVASVNTLSPWYNASAGTLYAESLTNNTVPASSFPQQVGFSDGTINNRTIIFTFNSSGTNRVNATGNVGGVQQYTLDSASTNVSPGSVAKAAFGYATNDIAFSTNSSAALTDTVATIPTVTTLYIGNANLGGNFYNGWIRRITYYPRRLSNAELQAITT